MLYKNQPIKFCRPVSNMRTVLQAVEGGLHYRRDIVRSTALAQNKVCAALYNLCFIGVLRHATDAHGRSMYVLPGQCGPTATCLHGVRSIFDVR
jgi:hypothetical protein